MFEAWESLGEHFWNNKNIRIAEMDCDPPENKKICKKFKVDQFPMIFMFKEGIQGKLYDGSREKEDLVSYIEQFLGELEPKRDET